MTAIGKVCLGVGVLGAVAGIGYAVVRYVRRKRAQNAERDEPEGRDADKDQAEDDLDQAEDTLDQAEDTLDQAEDTLDQVEDEALAELEPGPEPEPAAEPAHAPRPTAEPTTEPTSTPSIEPGDPPSAPLEEPRGSNARTVITRSTTDAEYTVEQSPQELLEQARKHDPTITMDELTGARLAASEHGSGTFTELACIVDAELNRAERRGKSLFQSLTPDGRFGRQGGKHKRRASTRQDPQMRHLWAARAVLSGKARGISRGAVQFFDPRDAYRLHARYREWVDGGRIGKPKHAVTCDALDLLEVWSFDYAKKKKRGPRCPPDRNKTGSYTLAWVGPIPGVDPWRLMLMKRMKPGQDHTLRYRAAREILQQGIEAEKAKQAEKS